MVKNQYRKLQFVDTLLLSKEITEICRAHVNVDVILDSLELHMLVCFPASTLNLFVHITVELVAMFSVSATRFESKYFKSSTKIDTNTETTC